jgi:hypothetical protein
MNVKEVPGAFYVSDVAKHFEIKDAILNSIKESGTYSVLNTHQKIYNTDWHLDSTFPRPYWNIFYPHCLNHLKEISDYCGFVSIEISNYWYQQYGYEGFHDWHIHPNCTFSSVYFLELPTENLSTTFRFNKNEFQIDIKEGQILTFPAFYTHESKPNLTNKIKTIISFNSLVTAGGNLK